MDNLAVNIVGWIGSAEVIIAYALISYTKINSKSLLYQLLNLTGSGFLIINTLYFGAIPSAFVNIIWALIAIGAIFQIIKHYRNKNGIILKKSL